MNTYVRKEPRQLSDSEPSIKTGSGFLLYKTAFVLTAYHVIKGNVEVRVSFPSGASYAARMVARDANNDVAILKLLEFTASDAGLRLSLSDP